MAKRNYRELWEQLKVIIICGGRVRWNRELLFRTMSDLELLQLSQDPLNEIIKVAEKAARGK